MVSLDSQSLSIGAMVKELTKWHGGKGSKQRPTDAKKYQDNWDRIFSKPKKEEVKDGKKEVKR